MTKTIIVPEREFWNEADEVFVKVPATELVLEHSLFSISKWEAIWHKPFLSREDRTVEETRSYIQCMTVNHGVSPEVYFALTQNNITEVSDYIEDPMTATWFSKKPQRGRQRVYTSELLYYYMIAFKIPFECEHWHINRLLTLIRICDEENSTSGKRGKKGDTSKHYAEVNAARKKMSGSKG